MKRGSLVVAFALLAVLVVAAPAGAVPRKVASTETIGNPAWAGDDVVYLAETRRAAQLRTVRPGGRPRVIGRFGAKPQHENPLGDLMGFYTLQRVDIRASAQAVAAHEELESGDRYMSQSSSNKVAIGPPAGPVKVFDPFCSREATGTGPAIDVSGPAIAFARETCGEIELRTRHVVVRDEQTGAEYNGPASASREVRLAGRFVAYRPAGTEERVVVYDWQAGAVVKTLAGRIQRFDVQADGALAEQRLATPGTKSCPSEVRVHSLASPTPTTVGRCHTLIAIDSGQVALRRGASSRIAVATIGGGTREVPVPGTLAGEPDLSAGRLVFSTAGCSTDSGAVWVDDGTGPGGRPKRPRECSVRIPRRTLRVRRGHVKVPVACPTGCRGGITISRGLDNQLAYLDDDEIFEVGKGKRRYVSVDVAENLRRRYPRSRSIRVSVDVAIFPRVHNRFVTRVRHTRLRIR